MRRLKVVVSKLFLVCFVLKGDIHIRLFSGMMWYTKKNMLILMESI